jgi:Uma2 family endonuclease
MAHDLLAPWAELVPDAPYPMTAADLARLPEDGWNYELVRGRLVRMPPTAGGHGSIAQDLGMALRAYVKPRKLGEVLAAETGFRLAGLGDPEQNIYAPDLAFVRADRVPGHNTPEWDDFWPLAPDLVAEVASKSQFKPEMAKKAQDWLTAGVRLVWVIWPKRKEIDVWLPGQDRPAQTLKIGDALDGKDVVPGFSYLLADLFA